MKILCIEEGREYRPFRDLRSMPKAGKGLSTFPRESRAGIFSLFRNSDRLVGTFSWLEDPSTAWVEAWLVPSTAEDPNC